MRKKARVQKIRSERTVVTLTTERGKPDKVDIKTSDKSTFLSLAVPKGCEIEQEKLEPSIAAAFAQVEKGADVWRKVVKASENYFGKAQEPIKTGNP